MKKKLFEHLGDNTFQITNPQPMGMMAEAPNYYPRRNKAGTKMVGSHPLDRAIEPAGGSSIVPNDEPPESRAKRDQQTQSWVASVEKHLAPLGAKLDINIGIVKFPNENIWMEIRQLGRNENSAKAIYVGESTAYFKDMAELVKFLTFLKSSNAL